MKNQSSHHHIQTQDEEFLSLAKSHTTLSLFDLPFDSVTLDDCVKLAHKALQSKGYQKWVTPNLDIVMKAHHDPKLRKFIHQADLVLADGKPICWMSKILGNPLPERVAGSDLTPALLQLCARNQLKVALFGSDDKTMQKLKTELPFKYAGLQLTEAIAPPVGNVSDWDNEDYTKKIRESGADLLLVALGCPKQEEWIEAWGRKTGVKLSIGIGASLDFIVGKQIRAPKWMQDSGLEWFWRMMSNPQRLAKRYAHDLLFFAKEMMSLRIRREYEAHQNLIAFESQEHGQPIKLNDLNPQQESFFARILHKLDSTELLEIDFQNRNSIDREQIVILKEIFTECLVRGIAVDTFGLSKELEDLLKISGVMDFIDDLEKPIRNLYAEAG